MEAKLKRPKSLIIGKEYLWQENTGSVGAQQKHRCAPTVTFVAYCSCPALVVVRDESGKKWRCPRDEIFTLQPIYQDLPVTELAAAAANSINRLLLSAFICVHLWLASR